MADERLSSLCVHPHHSVRISPVPPGLGSTLMPSLKLCEDACCYCYHCYNVISDGSSHELGFWVLSVGRTQHRLTSVHIRMLAYEQASTCHKHAYCLENGVLKMGLFSLMHREDLNFFPTKLPRPRNRVRVIT